MRRSELVELIEWQKSRLSPRARELWDEFDAYIFHSEDDRVGFTPQQVDVMERISKLPQSDKRVLDPLRQLRAGLYASDHAEARGEPGEPSRIDFVKAAAVSLDVRQGRRADSYATLEEALARLREDD